MLFSLNFEFLDFATRTEDHLVLEWKKVATRTEDRCY